jgi:peptidoglycan glycosyltransferase
MYEEQPTKVIPPAHYYPAVPPPTRKKRGCLGCLGRLFITSLLLLAIIIFSGAAIVGTLVYTNLSREIEDGIAKLDSAYDRETFETTRILDRDGNVLWEIFGEGKRTKVTIDQIPQHLIQATVSVEDDTFYENIGLDAPSLIAALIANFRNPDDRPISITIIKR